MAAGGAAIVGTPDDCIAAIARMQDDPGGFGDLLAARNEWASREATPRGDELLARYVMPHVQGTLAGVKASAARVRGRDA